MATLSPPLKLLICILFSLALLPFQPEGLSTEGYYVTVILAGLLLSFFLKPYSMGLMVLSTLVLLASLKLISFQEALAGFSKSVVWLVIAAFMIAKVIIDSNLGRRIALLLIKQFGQNTLCLAYAISFSELLFGPFVASNTARGGGIMSPIVNNKLNALGITPQHDPEKIGQYLIMTATHSNVITSAMFLTGMAANPLISQFAEDYLSIQFDWLTWALGAIVPGLCALLLLPLFLYGYFRPGQINRRLSQAHALKALKELGPIKSEEKIVGLIFIGLIIGWISSGWHGLSATLVAWFGVLGLLFSKSLSWKGFIRNHLAWDALIWLGGLITIIGLLSHLKVIDFFINTLNPEWLATIPVLSALMILLLFYLYSMYACTMLTAHIGAFLGAIFVVCAELNTPPLLTVALFAYFSNLCATLTHYSTGQVVIYYSYNYVSIPSWFSVGFLLSLYHLLIWLGLGLPWWHFLGWWS